MNIETAIVTSLGGVLTGVLAYLKTKKGKAKTLAYAKRLFNLDLTADDLRNSIENMSMAVDAQGNSIQWLTQTQDTLIQQIELYKTELDAAKEKLKEMETLHMENSQLRTRVAELESQVKALEVELARRKKFTPKKYKEDEDVAE
jgi:septal ring factor EnvC (AmiA/AmiB activator)